MEIHNMPERIVAAALKCRLTGLVGTPPLIARSLRGSMWNARNMLNKRCPSRSNEALAMTAVPRRRATIRTEAEGAKGAWVTAINQ
jgi:hypothetical protein